MLTIKHTSASTTAIGVIRQGDLLRITHPTMRHVDHVCLAAYIDGHFYFVDVKAGNAYSLDGAKAFNEVEKYLRDIGYTIARVPVAELTVTI